MSSPKIIAFSWGKMEIEGLGVGKDYKLWPGGGRPWDWNECGTGHGNGIQIGDVDDLITNGAEVVILTRGILSRLKVPAQTREYLANNDIEVIVANSKKGVKLYNDLVQKGVPVGGLFHSTC